jgi:hypothetical protein
MRPHPRIRKSAKWTLSLLSLPLAAAAVGSIWYSALINYADPADGVVGSADVSHGILQWSRYWSSTLHPASFKWNVYRTPPNEPAPAWTWHFYDPGPIGKHLFMPLWLPAPVLVVAAGLLWLQDIRMRYRDLPGHCHKCGYDRRGLPTDCSCPECGGAAPGGKQATSTTSSDLNTPRKRLSNGGL